MLFDLAPDVQQEGAVGRVDHLRARERVDHRQDAVPVRAPGGVDDDVAHALAAVDLDEVDGADHAPGLADRGGEVAEHALSVRDLHADRQAVLRARCGAHVAVSRFLEGHGC